MGLLKSLGTYEQISSRERDMVGFPQQYTLFVILAPITTALIVAIISRIWRERKGWMASSLIWLLVSVAGWLITNTAELIAPSESQTLFWTKLCYLFIAATPFFWLVFTFRYAGQEVAYKPRVLMAYATIPIITVLLAWTNELHGWLGRSHTFISTGRWLAHRTAYGLWFWIHTTYSYLLILIGAGLMVRQYLRSLRLYQKQSRWLIVGALIPLITNVIYLTNLIPPLQKDYTPISFALAGIAMSGGIFRHHLLNLKPVAHDIVLERIPDAILTIDAQGRLIDMNPAAQRLFDEKLDALIGQPVTTVLPAWETWAQTLQAQDEPQTSFLLEDDNSHRVYEARVFSLTDPRGNRKGWVVQLHDITERKQAEEALKASEERYRQLVELSPETIVVYRDGKIKFINSAAVELMRASDPQELLGKPILDFVHPDDRELARARITNTLATGETAPLFEERLLRLDSTTVDVEVTTARLEYQGQPALQTIARDITARKQAEAALRESEQRYRSLFWNNHAVMLIINPHDGAIVDANPAATAYYGWTQEELRQKKINQINTLSPPEVEAEMKRAKLERRRHFFFQHRRADGSIRDVEVFSGPILLKNRTLLYSIIHDITARKRAEAVLRLRLHLMNVAADRPLEEPIQYVLDEIGELTKSPLGFYCFVNEDQQTLSFQVWSTETPQALRDVEGQTLQYGRERASIWGNCVRQQEPIIQNDIDPSQDQGLPPEWATVKRQLVIPTIRQGQSAAILGIANKPWAYDEEDVKLVTFATDLIWNIVERRQREDELQAYRRRLETQNLELRKLTLAIEQSGSAIVITDTNGVIKYANPHFEKITGYTVDEALGANLSILKSGKQSPAFHREMWETITSGAVWRGEYHNRRKDGTLYWEMATIAPVTDPDGAITHYIATKEDITARKEAEEALRSYAEQLAAQNAELDAFAHTVAHDLKNPLSIMLGHARLLKSTYTTASPEMLGKSIQAITKSGDKLNNIIDELLLLASVRKQEVTAVPLTMAEIVQSALDRLASVIQAKRAKISSPEPADWPMAMGYAPWIEEVWANYLSNALKYGGEPPHVELGYTRLDAYPETEEPQQPTSHVQFWVCDHGPGLTQDAQSKLFTGFTRLDQVRATGHGLGLSIVRRIVDKLNGTVGVESKPGEGSCFYFTLPSAPHPAP